MLSGTVFGVGGTVLLTGYFACSTRVTIRLYSLFAVSSSSACWAALSRAPLRAARPAGPRARGRGRGPAGRTGATGGSGPPRGQAGRRPGAPPAAGGGGPSAPVSPPAGPVGPGWVRRGGNAGDPRPIPGRCR